jgi:hypothetical protein
MNYEKVKVLLQTQVPLEDTFDFEGDSVREECYNRKLPSKMHRNKQSFIRLNIKIEKERKV